MSVIQIQNLTRDYGNSKGVFDVSFEVGRGEVFGFLGPNGAGKTTAIRHLLGFLQPRAGKCSIGGLDCWEKSTEIKQNIGYIPGEMNLFEDMKGQEFLKFMSDYRGMKSGGRKKELLERFELDARGKFKKMSKGMKQKLGIISAFMHDPEVLILDEPTSGLDPLMQKRFIELINEEKAKGKTILMSSHQFDEVERTCHRIGIIRGGRIAAIDNTDVLREKHCKSYNVTLDSAEIAADFAKDFGGVQDGARVRVNARQTLEEIFLRFYGRGGNQND